MPRIDISEESYVRLLSRVESFDDSPDSVIRGLLDESEENKLKRPDPNARARSPRRIEGELLPEAEYWRPILRLLRDAGGSARGSDVIDDLEPELRSRLSAADEDILSMGEVRWRNRARFARLRMKELGLISSESPRGIWEITPRGIEYLESQHPD